MTNLVNKDKTYYSAQRKEMLKYIDFQPSAILEVGCGEANFASNFDNVEYWGVEPSVECANIAISKSLKILTGRYEDVENEIPDHYFDLVVCNDVIEHMTDPIKFLKTVKKKLKPSGKLIASIPNIRNAVIVYNLLVHGEFDYTESGILDYTHFHLFTHKSFCKIARECGWNVEIIEPISFTTFSKFKNLILKIFEWKSHDLRNVQFAVRLSLPNVSDNI